MCGYHELRWIRNRVPGNGYQAYHDRLRTLEGELLALEEIMGACRGTIGLGRRIGIEICHLRKSDPVTVMREGTAVVRVDARRRHGIEVARGWAQALVHVIEDGGIGHEMQTVYELTERLAALRSEQIASRRRATAKQTSDWLERTFEAFVQDEAETTCRGDTDWITREGAEPDSQHRDTKLYPQTQIRERSNWLWHLFRAMLEWTSDGVSIVGGPGALGNAEASRLRHLDRTQRIKVEFARLSARSMANARVARHELAAVMDYDEAGADADVVRIGESRANFRAGEDDGKIPALDDEWLRAQAVEAMTAGFRDVIGLSMIEALAVCRHVGDGRYMCVDTEWDPPQGVDGKGDPTYGNLAVAIITFETGYPLLQVENAQGALRAIGENVAEAIARRSGTTPDELNVMWEITHNRFWVQPGNAGWGSATEVMTGERTGKIRPRMHNAATAWTGPRGPGA